LSDLRFAFFAVFDHVRATFLYHDCRTGLWVGDCFIYNNAAWRLNYCVGGEVTTLFHLDKPMYLLGYLAAQSRVYLIDR
jgi:hypothetical protein